MRVLACGEYSQLTSGYAVYMKELLKRLNNIPGVQLAELACFCSPDDYRLPSVPWKVYPVAPLKSDNRAVEIYNSNPLNAFGANTFNDVLLDFKPTHVIDFRDSWHFEYQCRSPLRKYFAHVIMPAVDAYPQHKTWIDMYAEADKVLSYTDWGLKVLKNAGLRNTFAAASPCAPLEYYPMAPQQKADLQKSLGLGDITIVGTVMRNQRRKLFPELFRDFSNYLKTSKRNDVFLLCHTSNPDTWELDELMLNNEGILNRVLFTYMCRNNECGNVDFSFYRGIASHCQKCNQISSTFTNVQYGVNNQAMNIIYNAMDLYIQYATCEGYGMPLAEALACGVPIMAVDYSAMGEIVKQANGYPVKPLTFYIEPETGRRMAMPDSNSFVDGLTTLLKKSKSELIDMGAFSRMLYGMRAYDDVAKTWYEALKSVQPSKAWDSPPIKYNMNIKVKQELNNSNYARWLITEVLQAPEYIGTFLEARLIRDITNGIAYRGIDRQYFHEDISGRNGMTLIEFSRDTATKHFGTLLEERQMWEDKRIQSLKGK